MRYHLMEISRTCCGTFVRLAAVLQRRDVQLAPREFLFGILGDKTGGGGAVGPPERSLVGCCGQVNGSSHWWSGSAGSLLHIQHVLLRLAGLTGNIS